MRVLIVLVVALCGYGLNAQDFMLQGWYWDYPSANCGGLNTKWAVNLQTQASTLGNAGFTYVWLPPPAKGGSECSVGYDPKDLYDLGDFGPTRFGSRAQLDGLISALQNNGMEAVADVVYNHRDGGDYEDNPGVRNYIMNYPNVGNTCNNGVTPYPINGKTRWRLPLGGSSGNNAGDYYFKFSSASGNPGFHGRGYNLYFQTSQAGWLNMSDLSEVEPNGGGDCGTPDDQTTITLGRNMLATIDNGGCGVDEFLVVLNPGDFNSAGDYLEIYVSQSGGDGTGVDIRPYGLYAAPRGADIINELALQTRTDFTNMPSGQGAMNYLNFKPNGIDPTCLEGDWDFPYFFFDVDQREASTQTVYNEWSEWLIESVGFTGGLRMDAVKHFDPAMVTDLLNYLSSQGIEPGMIVGEIFDSSTGALNGWVNSVNNGLTANVDVRAFDFSLRSALKEACDRHYFNTSYDVRNVFNAGMVAAGASSFSAVTFVNNHDFRDANQPVQDDPLLAYVYILTNNKVGLPCVFYPDFFGDQPPHYPATNIQAEITELMSLHQDFIFGASEHYYLNRFGTPYASSYLSGNANQCLIYQIIGGPSNEDVVVAINFGNTPLQVDHQINLDNVPYGATFEDMTGNSAFPFAIAKNSPGGVPNSIYIDLPARSYSVWVYNSGITPLPAELLSFQAKQEGLQVHLDWRTAQEEQLSHFRIERSEDGKLFRPVGQVAAVGNSQEEQSYSFLDRQLSRIRGEYLYYRLAMVDVDGSEEISPVREIHLPFNQIQVWPNPVDNELHLTTQQAIDQIMVLNAHGQLQYRQSANGRQCQLFTNDWESGVYQLLIILSNGEQLHHRFVKL
ncbi:alpha-amylase family glycosyl hydrolase [Lewinella sp. LCG006]|uniref:alpha-amylase family glycosyl hydrolase n=1 Tax=Lewinella sp. LCG006 TaxID=3231911 RepID=UPI00345FB841